MGSLGDLASLDRMLVHDRAQLRVRLRDIVSRLEIREALFIASPHLDEALGFWEREPDTDRGRGIERALLRYFFRMAGRATPFGLFAGSSVGLLGGETHLVVAERANYQRHTRLSMNYLFALTESLRGDHTLRRAFTYRPNSSLCRVAGRLRYAASRLKDKDLSYHLVVLEDAHYLASTLACAGPGAAFAALAAALVHGNVTLKEAEAYIDELIDSQILVADIPLSVTGDEPLDRLIEHFREHPETISIAERLDEVRAELAAMDIAGLAVPPSRYRLAARLLDGLPAEPDLSRLFQIDLIKPARKATLGKTVLAEIARGVELLYRLEIPVGPNELTRFRDRFTQRYEMREVPLMETLDEEDGVGFGSGLDTTPLLEGLHFPFAPDAVDPPWGDREKVLIRKLSEVLQSGSQEMALTSDDLDEMANPNPPSLPAAFSATAVVAASSDDALARGDFRVVLNSGSGPAGASALGRFCHADAELRKHVEKHLRTEESFQPDAIFAEIVHLPEGRAGFLCRPTLRVHEIPYLGFPSMDFSEQIAVSDLTVSVRNERIVLRSTKRNREVIPRMTNSHNYDLGSLGVYEFLCALQRQGVHREWGFTWGLLRHAPFLPRVVTGRLVLRRAQWRVEKKELKSFVEVRDAALFQFVQSWRAKRCLPRWVTVTERDHRLPVDFDNVLSVEMFVHLVRNREELLLVEIYPGPDELCARGPEGRFIHELIVPFSKTSPIRHPTNEPASHTAGSETTRASLPKNVAESPIVRTFPPGSEWLFAKLYAGSVAGEEMLLEVIAPLVQKVLASGAVDRWFFIRYNDPDLHLRLRFHGPPDKLQTEIFPALQSALVPLVKDGRLRRWQLDTYEREIERYGGSEGIILAERLFHADSEAVLKVMAMLDRGDEGLDERWRLTLRGIDTLLTDFGLDLESKCKLFNRIPKSISEIAGTDSSLLDELSEKFRRERKSLEDLLDPACDQKSPLSPGFDILRLRSEQMIPIVADWNARQRAGRLLVSLNDFAASCVHMHVNRMLRSAHREQELVIYDFLSRLYKSRAAAGAASRDLA